LYNTVVIRRI